MDKQQIGKVTYEIEQQNDPDKEAPYNKPWDDLGKEMQDRYIKKGKDMVDIHEQSIQSLTPGTPVYEKAREEEKKWKHEFEIQRKTLLALGVIELDIPTAEDIEEERQWKEQAKVLNSIARDNHFENFAKLLATQLIQVPYTVAASSSRVSPDDLQQARRKCIARGAYDLVYHVFKSMDFFGYKKMYKEDISEYELHMRADIRTFIDDLMGWTEYENP